MPPYLSVQFSSLECGFLSVSAIAFWSFKTHSGDTSHTAQVTLTRLRNPLIRTAASLCSLWEHRLHGAVCAPGRKLEQYPVVFSGCLKDRFIHFSFQSLLAQTVSRLFNIPKIFDGQAVGFQEILFSWRLVSGLEASEEQKTL
jgi:hypothetical protein